MTAADWSSPNSDPLGDVQRWLELMRDARWITGIEVSTETFNAIRGARSDAQRAAVVPGLAGPLWFAVPVYTDAEVPVGKARVSWSDGTVEVVPS